MSLGSSNITLLWFKVFLEHYDLCANLHISQEVRDSQSSYDLVLWEKSFYVVLVVNGKNNSDLRGDDVRDIIICKMLQGLEKKRASSIYQCVTFIMGSPTFLLMYVERSRFKLIASSEAFESGHLTLLFKLLLVTDKNSHKLNEE